MSLTRLEVRNWQSLRHVDLELGDFTVIVGPSSSGKSAFIRACKALASNVRGSDMITRGEKNAAITAHTDVGASITLERTETSGTYRLSHAGKELTFTKLNGGVPEQITDALGIDPAPATGVSVSFANQFDRPFLLDDSGATVARVLGEMTKVDTIFEAVRAANKIRLSAAATLKTRRSDLQSIKAKLVAYRDLADRLRALDVVEKRVTEAATLTTRIDRLERATRMLCLAEAAYDKASRLPAVPSPEPVNAALTRYLDLRAKVRGLIAKDDTAAAATNAVASVATRLAATETQLRELLVEAGVCPTCGQTIH